MDLASHIQDRERERWVQRIINVICPRTRERKRGERDREGHRSAWNFNLWSSDPKLQSKLSKISILYLKILKSPLYTNENDLSSKLETKPSFKQAISCLKVLKATPRQEFQDGGRLVWSFRKTVSGVTNDTSARQYTLEKYLSIPGASWRLGAKCRDYVTRLLIDNDRHWLRAVESINLSLDLSRYFRILWYH